MRYAIVENDVVTRVASSSFPLEAPWVTIPDNVDVHWIWDGQSYVAPVPPTPRTHRTRLTRLEFRNLFTQAEKQALYTAAQSSVDVQIYLDDVNAAQYIETTDPVTIAALNSLVPGVLTQARADEILEGIAL